MITKENICSTDNETRQPRLAYIDCLRGFSMILVVYSHVVLYGLGENASELNTFFMSFRMPLFFFISGFVSYKRNYNWNLHNFFFMENKKVRGQLLPTFIIMAIYVLYTNGNYLCALMSKHHEGYWFTIVSFQIYLVYAVLQVFMNGLKPLWKDGLILLSVALMCGGGYIIYMMYGMVDVKGVVAWFSWNYVTYYYLFFVAGTICKKYVNRVEGCLANKYFLFFLFVIACIPLTANEIVNYLIKMARVLVIYNIFFFYRDFFSGTKWIDKALAYLGRHTLEVYFLHFFLLYNFYDIMPSFKTNNMFVEFLVIGLISIIISTACLLIKKGCDSIPIVSELCFGPQKK